MKLACKEEALVSKCPGKCSKTLPCGHFCTERCQDPCGIECKVSVASDVVCPKGHTVKLPCSKKQELSCKSPLTFSTIDFTLITHELLHTLRHLMPYCSSLPPAGSSEDLWLLCDAPCGAELECGHTCRGTCGACLQVGRVGRACR